MIAHLVNHIHSAEVKDLLKNTVGEAVSRGEFLFVSSALCAPHDSSLHAAGAYGAPFIVVSGPGLDEDMVFFGSDRFEQLAFVAKKKYSGPFPPSRL